MSEGQKGRKHSQESRDKISKRHKGRKASPETIEKMKLRYKSKGIPNQEKRKQNQLLAVKGIKWSDERKEKLKESIKQSRGIKINQYDVQGNHIKKWESTSEVAKYLNCKHISSIHSACKTKTLLRGYQWRYVTDTEVVKMYTNIHGKSKKYIKQQVNEDSSRDNTEAYE